MTDNEIIKALETARYHLTAGKHKKAINDAIDRICHKQVEIETLLRNIKAMSNIAKATRHEAYKVFAERLKQRASLGEFPWDDLTVTMDQIDELVKEMVGENND